MTTSGVATADFDVATITELAGRKAGWEVEELNAGHARVARQLLTAILNEWSNRDLIPWAADRRTLTTQANVESYPLAADVVDLMTGATITSDDDEFPLLPISREEHASITNKAVRKERPAQYWLWRKGVPTLFLFPIPDKAYTVTYWCIRRLQDVTAAQQTVDAPMRWVNALIDRLALGLFDVMPMERRLKAMGLRPSLEAMAARSEDLMRTSEVDQGSWFVFGA